MLKLKMTKRTNVIASGDRIDSIKEDDDGLFHQFRSLMAIYQSDNETANSRYSLLNETEDGDDSISSENSDIILCNNLTSRLTTITCNLSATSGVTTTSDNATAGRYDNITKLILNQNKYKISMDWSDICLIIIFCLLIVIIVIGNTLVILSVLTTRRLRTVTNCFVTSLALADWLVGIFVMPPAVAVHIMGSWELGWILCDIWISLDVLLCTASILSLCAISIDRYLAVTQPLNYSRRRRSKRLALIMILVVWVLALAITCPPILGWYEQGRRSLDQCRYNQNVGYVIFSALGSFFLPMSVMIYVYVRISCVVASRHDQMAEIVHKKTLKNKEILDMDYEQDTSEHEPSHSPHRKRSSGQIISNLNNYVVKNPNPDDNSNGEQNNHKNCHYELVDIPTAITTTSNKRGKNITYKLTTNLDSCAASGIITTTTTVPSESINTPPALNNYNNSNNNNNTHHHHHHHNHSHQHYAMQQKQHQQHLQKQQQQYNCTNYNYPATSTSSSTPAGTTATTATTVPSQSTLRNIRVHHKSTRISSLKRESKTTQTLSIVVGGFIACWLPFFICYLLAPFLPTAAINPKLVEYFTWLGWINSAINPFIYAFYSVDFRAAFWRLTFRRFCKNSRRDPFTSYTMSMRR